jgi:hypothetical protein
MLCKFIHDFLPLFLLTRVTTTENPEFGQFQRVFYFQYLYLGLKMLQLDLKSLELKETIFLFDMKKTHVILLYMFLCYYFYILFVYLLHLYTVIKKHRHFDYCVVCFKENTLNILISIKPTKVHDEQCLCSPIYL